MEAYDIYEKEREAYLEYMEQLEEESINFERLQKEKEWEEKKKKYEQLFEEF